ncbi:MULTISPECIES: hypothetical protein [Mycobacterium]|uniref:Uncharacterized protein n=1 Tax=Mycobacterium kiyosense TaxID=2871094 RepID=A0A9P3QAU5_9MYCO|nr:MULTISPECIES: hypothetical protein [Mycobacterium]BDB42265.1 hypothetical protein IWGMT90018_27110 [Mycobacterium kiyosense]BDE14463.1 hypothetical protein MKCMC460_33230 [Mycobacterium sp. 20KCMC460]GLB83823.1 hypothetical protein SRL2020028_30790 [Mycobacterium kiyosense]GLB97261.1 hypothetical protein SRL2020226_40370 [Mycobacterium kiyosense]GLC02165.1 hypothetical protein SRL2020400_27560 [Mycobacterium kiyosense]
MARDLGPDPTAELTVAVGARQSLIAGSQYLLTTLADEPAVAPDLASAIHKLAVLFQGYAMNYLNGQTNAEMASSLRDGDETTSVIEKLCQ